MPLASSHAVVILFVVNETHLIIHRSWTAGARESSVNQKRERTGVYSSAGEKFTRVDGLIREDFQFRAYLFQSRPGLFDPREKCTLVYT